MPDRPQNPSKNRVFTVDCVLNNVVYLTEKTWQGHSLPRHSDQELIGDVEEVKATLTHATRARRSTHPKIGPDTCVYERIIEGTNTLMRVPVIFEGPEYDKGNMVGRVTTVFTLDHGEWDSGQVGEIFWVAKEVKKDQP